MLSRIELLEAVNALNSRYAGRQVGFVNGYHDQWFLGGSIASKRAERQTLQLRFCQGRNVGRINSNGGYPVALDLTGCQSLEDVFGEFVLLDHHKRREKEKAEALRLKLEARCHGCIHFLGHLTGNCSPSAACGYKRTPKRKGKCHVP